MNICPVCKANVEGLLFRCDCCGAPLKQQNDFFIWHAFVTQASGDLSEYLEKLLSPLNFAMRDNTGNNSKIILEVYCYPQKMYAEHGIKDKTRFLSKRRVLRITMVMDYEEYIYKNKDGKEEMLREMLKKRIKAELYKYADKLPPCDEYLRVIEQLG